MRYQLEEKAVEDAAGGRRLPVRKMEVMVITRPRALVGARGPRAKKDQLVRLPEPEAAGPAPATPSQEPVEVVFAAPETPGHATWAALEYEPGETIRYRYTLLPSPAGCGAPTPEGSSETILTLRAEGDLDGDGVLSSFERGASAGDGELTPHPLLVVTDRIE